VTGFRHRDDEPTVPGSPISPDDIARRIGMAGASPKAPDLEAPSHRLGRQRLTRRRVDAGPAARLVLWRDASLLLLVVVSVIFVAQLGLPGIGGGGAGPADGSPDGASQAVFDATGLPAPTGPPSIGPVVDPSLIDRIEATPTPRATPNPAPRPTPRPTAKPAPPTAAPTPTDSPSTPPSPPASPTSSAPATPSPAPGDTPSPAPGDTPSPAPLDTPSPGPTDTPGPTPTDTPAP
jgi:hypothetical protein